MNKIEEVKIDDFWAAYTCLQFSLMENFLVQSYLTGNRASILKLLSINLNRKLYIDVY